MFAVRRADIEAFARELEVAGRARATVTRRLSTIAGFWTVAFSSDLAPVSYLTSLLQAVVRLTGPVLLGLAVLALRGRVKR